MAKDRSARSGRLLTCVGVVMLLIGAALLFEPLVEGAVARHEMDEEISKVEKASQVVAETADGTDAGETGPAGASAANAYADLRAWLESYNQQVLSGSIDISADPFAFEGAIDEFESQGLGDGLIGYVKIPAMNTSLPLYLGSTAEHLRRGATVVEGSSAPLGQATGNCVIAAHRGYGSPSMMFRDIEKLEVGNKIYVTTLWETLTYTVTGTKVIDPSDTAAVGIQQGRDLVTLITCHPYGSTASRYVVECERTDDAAGETGTTGSNATEVSSTTSATQTPRHEPPSVTEIEDSVRFVGGLILLICAVLLAAQAMRNRHRRTPGRHSK